MSTIDEARNRLVGANADTFADIVAAQVYYGRRCSRVLIATDVEIETYQGRGAVGAVVAVEDLTAWLVENGTWSRETGDVETDARVLSEYIRDGVDTWGSTPGEMSAGVTVLWRDVANRSILAGADADPDR
jgi:hypothetical protein